MVLCGVGGRTIAEAQSRLSYEEFWRWAEYRRKRGSLHVGMRIEHAAALLAQLTANRYRKEGTEPFQLYDFAPHTDRPEEPEMTLKDLKDWE